jgi:hypothetical protein
VDFTIVNADSVRRQGISHRPVLGRGEAAGDGTARSI